jgi:hypothetical protein
VKLLDTNRFYLPGTSYLHIGSVQDGMREYVCFYQRIGHKLYIEEITTGELKKMEDD